MSGPLQGLRILEVAAIGPAPFGVMLLADLGAEVVRVDRVKGGELQELMRGLGRGRRSVAIDLKQEEGVELLLRLVDDADVLVEGFRPGVAERLGFGPEVCRERNPGLIYARTTGWGQGGPLSQLPGHDLNYAGIAGALHPIGSPDRPPPPPLNFLADFGGGGAFLALGVLAALYERQGSGVGQVLDVAMVDGTAVLTAFFHGLLPVGGWTTERCSNLLDGGAPYYRCYTTSDGAFMAVGALEPRFYTEFLQLLDLDPEEWPQDDRDRWPEYHRAFAEIFAGRTREEWTELFRGTEACVTPVLSLAEAPQHPHLQARGTFREVDGEQRPAPAPRFSRTPPDADLAASEPGAHTEEILAELGLDQDALDDLRERGIVA